MNKLRAWFAGLQERERRVISVGAVTVAVLILLFGILLPLEGTVSGLHRRNETKREDLKWMQVNQAIIAQTPLPVDGGEPPVVLVDRTGREAGLTDALRGTAPSGNGVRVQLEEAPFDDMIPWLARLDESYGLSIESITLDRTAKPGLVNASITFTHSRP
jgi:general secretion pathway protein M